MKRVIDCLIYDTDTAKKIAAWSNDLGSGDFNDCFERLYRTEKGNFFVAGEGRPNTRWNKPAGSMRTGGEGIIAMTEQEAIVWCETHEIDGDTIVKHFGDCLEDA